MRHVKFTVEENEEYGGFGIIPKIFRRWGSYLPTTMPGHDLIDHTAKESGEVWQELRALGANLFVHQFGKHLYRLYEDMHYAEEKGKNFTSDIENTFRDADTYLMDFTLPEPPKFHLSKKEKDLFKLFEQGIEDALREDEYEDYSILAEQWKEQKGKIINWMRYGFFNAKRRYKGEFYCAEIMKETLNKTVNKALTVLENAIGTGEEFTLSFDLENNHAKITGRYGEIF